MVSNNDNKRNKPKMFTILLKFDILTTCHLDLYMGSLKIFEFCGKHRRLLGHMLLTTPRPRSRGSFFRRRLPMPGSNTHPLRATLAFQALLRKRFRDLPMLVHMPRVRIQEFEYILYVYVLIYVHIYTYYRSWSTVKWSLYLIDGCNMSQNSNCYMWKCFKGWGIVSLEYVH